MTFEQVIPGCGSGWPVRMNTLNLAEFVLIRDIRVGTLKVLSVSMLLSIVLSYLARHVLHKKIADVFVLIRIHFGSFSIR
jgi:hypothetical protein